MENELEILTAFVSRTLNLDPVKVAALLKTDDGKIKADAIDILLVMDAKRVSELKGKGGDTKEAFDNGFKKAHKELADKFDTDVKTHYEITSDAKGLDLIGEIVKAKTKALENKEITADEIKTNPIYQSTIAGLNTRHTEQLEEVKNTYESQIAEYKRKESLTGVIHAADQLINTQIKPIFSEDPLRASNQRKVIHEAISQGNFKENPGGMPIVLDSEGKALEDQHGIAIPFDKFVESKVTSFLDVQTTEQRQGAGKPPGDGNKPKEGYTWNGQKPKNDAEYTEAIKNAKSTEEKVEIKKAYRGE